MDVKLRCFSCGKRLSVDEKYAGKRGRCPTCGQVIIVPRIERGTVLSVDYTPGSGSAPSRLGEVVDKIKKRRGKLVSQGLLTVGILVLLIAAVIKFGHRIPVVRTWMGHSKKIIEETIEDITSEDPAAETEEKEEVEKEEGEEK
ncbi:MAG: hypothetical protein AMS15_00575 [Planctomycetes bacterium DG_23]|nr:MAG: hypothetical protein AMS15_00575 [Planctomycetes bacterium DG_23]